MALRTEYLGQKSKVTRGIEITTEALLALLDERFPNLVDWRQFLDPVIDASPQVGIIGLYQHRSSHRIDQPVYDDNVAWPFRRTLEGLPVPTGQIRLSMVQTAEGLPRCGYFNTHVVVDGDAQCGMVRGHEGAHGKVVPLDQIS